MGEREQGEEARRLVTPRGKERDSTRGPEEPNLLFEAMSYQANEWEGKGNWEAA